ncbi:MAG: DNA methyltransferase [Chitinivibrionales bacterium]
MNIYKDICPIDEPISAERQSAKRHYGVHPYFTRRPYNVVKKYILHYSREGDKVIDPFGGSGVTAIEAFLNNRIGIQNDINPFANFIAQGVVNLHKGNISEYYTALADLQNSCKRKIEQIEASDDLSLENCLHKISLPPNLPLPSNSDVETYHELFLPKQLVALAVLKEAINAIEKEYVRNGLLLAWSATLTKLNKTFLSAEGRLASRGGSSLFSIYRYKVAKKPVSLPGWQTFYERASNIIEAKKEIEREIEARNLTVGWKGQFYAYEKDIEEIADELKGEIDYIFTDPPYGAHIAYLDLSTLWNGWLGLMPSPEANSKELIVGGDFKHTEDEYVERLGQSVKACVKMLKIGRWLSIVFQHWNTRYFESILRSASESGMELRAAISQVGDPVWSMHKKKGSESVLAGELILTFFKSGVVARKKNGSNFDLESSIDSYLNSVKNNHIFGEYLFNKVIMDAWEKGALSALSISKSTFADIIKNHGWHYDSGQHCWIRNDVSTSNNISLLSLVDSRLRR